MLTTLVQISSNKYASLKLSARDHAHHAPALRAQLLIARRKQARNAAARARNA
jgi:hypothetical protein